MKYEMIDDGPIVWIQLLEDPYQGIEYCYGSVELLEKDDAGVLQFNYEIRDKRFVVQFEKDEAFKKIIGDILVGMLETQIKNNEVIYKGGE